MPCTLMVFSKQTAVFEISFGDKGPFLDVKDDTLYEKYEGALQHYVQVIIEKGLYHKAVHEDEACEVAAHNLQAYMQQRFPIDNVTVEVKPLGGVVPPPEA